MFSFFSSWLMEREKAKTMHSDHGISESLFMLLLTRVDRSTNLGMCMIQSRMVEVSRGRMQWISVEVSFPTSFQWKFFCLIFPLLPIQANGLYKNMKEFILIYTPILSFCVSHWGLTNMLNAFCNIMKPAFIHCLQCLSYSLLLAHYDLLTCANLWQR